MTYRFTANIAYGWHEPGPDNPDPAMTAGVAESEGGESFELQFQCSFEEPDAQNIRNGSDSYCVVTPNQGTAYGCVRTVELEGDTLRVTFDPDSLEALFLDDPVVEAVLHAPAADTARMREALTRILSYGRPDALPIVIGV
ncbi:Imm10 family immunity protein [Streptomyces albogriseolus]|uniref:Imm10 family immunity protein n=1 Tax=Streptomyces albogriseolus TaxID=1887 RepID=UPI003460A039